jgi:DNA-binding CsgD family transcriptional regulator
VIATYDNQLLISLIIAGSREMLEKTEQDTLPLKDHLPMSRFKVLNQFVIQSNSISIVAFEELEDTEQRSQFNQIYKDCSFCILGWFELNSIHYAIVKFQQPSENAELSLSQLLTDRELQIATLVASGCSNKQVANQLRISEWTVSAHLRRIFIKLNVDSRSAMVYRCASLIQQFDQLQQLSS